MEVRLNKGQKEPEGSEEELGYLSSPISAETVFSVQKTSTISTLPRSHRVYTQAKSQCVTRLTNNHFFSCPKPLLMVCGEPGLSGGSVKSVKDDWLQPVRHEPSICKSALMHGRFGGLKASNLCCNNTCMLENVKFLFSLYFPSVTQVARCSFPNICSGPNLGQPLFVPNTRVVTMKLQFDTHICEQFPRVALNPTWHITQ